MGIKVLVTSTPKNRVSINNQQRETIRTVGITTPVKDRFLSQLSDVDATDPDTNETLVYDATAGKYVVKTLPIVDGGSY